MMRRIVLVALVLLVLLLAGLAWGASRFNMSALEKPGEMETYLATQAKRWLVGRSAREIVPRPVDNPAMARFAGKMTFGGSCATCHGYDGRTPTDIGRS